MGFWGNFINGMSAGVSAFREAQLNSDPLQGRVTSDFDSWNRWESRQTRYDLNWSMYQNNAYQAVLHPGWAARYKAAFALYKHIRHIYNPAYRIGEFWVGHLMGGMLDRDAGADEQSALPILTDNEDLRAAIARTWRDSLWQTNKDVYTRYGAILGDVALKGEADVEAGKASLQVVHPGHLRWVDQDRLGRVLSYILQEWRYDPRAEAIGNLSPQVNPQQVVRRVLYTERAYLDGRKVVYETLLNGEPFSWNGVAAKWERPYGFVPLWLCQHENVGMPWGWNCFHAGLSRFREVDDQASGLGDQNRKVQRAPKLIAGVKAKDLELVGATPTATDPQPDRQEIRSICVPKVDVQVHDLASTLDVVGTCEHIRDILADIEKNYPELMADLHTSAGDASGRALRVARQKAAARVQTRRAGYDQTLVEAQKGVVLLAAIEGFDGYEPFSGMDPDSPELRHSIGPRPVFEVDPLDSIEEDQAFWTAAKTAGDAGCPLELYLERNGWSAPDIARLKDLSAQVEAARAAATPPGNPGTNPEAAPETAR